MALSRCLEKHSHPQGRRMHYTGYVYPMGYPDSALICGNPECDNPGVIWLNQEEEGDYRNGRRIFDGPNNFTKMKADDSGFHGLTNPK